MLFQASDHKTICVFMKIDISQIKLFYEPNIYQTILIIFRVFYLL